MNPRQLALVQGAADTRAALRDWNLAPGRVFVPWLAVSAVIAAGLLAAVLLVAAVAVPDPTPRLVPGVHAPTGGADVGRILTRNVLVLALHAMACVAGFIAMSALPQEAAGYRGWVRRLHDGAGRAAMAFVAGATLFSLGTQALALGTGLASLAPQLGTTPAPLLLALLPHAVPELVALFLPLAAWMVAARAGAWRQLLAATAVTVGVALPVLVAAASIEVFVTPRLLSALHFV